MLVIVSLRRLDNDRIEIAVARPQHDSNPTQNYASEKEVRAVLSDFGMQRRDNNFSSEIAGKNGHMRTVKIPTDLRTAKRFAV